MGKKIERDRNRAESGHQAGDLPLGSSLAREIDANLKRVYQETLDEGVPDRFAQLLAALRAKETGGSGDAG
jgi:hypothetical protein